MIIRLPLVGILVNLVGCCVWVGVQVVVVVVVVVVEVVLPCVGSRM